MENGMENRSAMTPLWSELFWSRWVGRLASTLQATISLGSLGSRGIEAATWRQSYDVYFNHLSGACSIRKLVKLLFFSRFQPFLLILDLFQWFLGWNQQKTSENEQKNVILSSPQSWLTCKIWSTLWGGTPKLSFFGWFFYWKRFKINKKGWKKVFWPSFLLQAPESWS